jgi:site-specific DNA recombinase
LQQRRGAGCADAGGTWNFVRGITAQGDGIRNLFWIDAISRANFVGPGDILKLNVKARIRRVGREMKLVVHNAEDRAHADPGLLRIVARAHDFQERLIQDPELTVPSIASQERLTIGYLSRLLRLPSLAPGIVTAILNGKHPPELSAKRLMRLSLKLPTDWAEQRKLLGFQRH